MPSMFTHMLVSEEALKNLKDPDLAGFLKSQKRYFLLGCLAPDFPYYEILLDYRGLSLGGALSAISYNLEGRLLRWVGLPQDDTAGESKPFWSRRLHGPRAADWILGWLENAAAGGNLNEQAMALPAFLLGMLTHVATDETMHPQVEADTGDQATLEGREAHRLLETYMDFWFLQIYGFDVFSATPAELLGRWLGKSVSNIQEAFPRRLTETWARATGQGRDSIPAFLIKRWLKGFDRAVNLLDHAFSPLRQAQQGLGAGQGAPWTRCLNRSAYLETYFPRSVAHSAEILDLGWKFFMEKEPLYVRPA